MSDKARIIKEPSRRTGRFKEVEPFAWFRCTYREKPYTAMMIHGVGYGTASYLASSVLMIDKEGNLTCSTANQMEHYAEFIDYLTPEDSVTIHGIFEPGEKVEVQDPIPTDLSNPPIGSRDMNAVAIGIPFRYQWDDNSGSFLGIKTRTQIGKSDGGWMVYRLKESTLRERYPSEGQFSEAGHHRGERVFEGYAPDMMDEILKHPELKTINVYEWI